MTFAPVAVHPIPVDLLDADDWLNAYGRWAFGGPTQKTCGSAERAYVSEAWQARELRRTPRERIPFDPLLVQRALAEMPLRTRQVLALLYVTGGGNPFGKLKKAGIEPSESVRLHLDGLRAMAAKLPRARLAAA